MRLDDHYPSFTSVMVKLEPSLRLPAYRSSYTSRFHPYPRGGPRRWEDTFTDGYAVHVEGPSSNSEPAQPRIRPGGCFAVATDNADVSNFELDIPVVRVDYDEDELVAAGIPTGLSRGKLASLLSDLLGALRRAFLDPTLGRLGGFKLGVQMPK